MGASHGVVRSQVASADPSSGSRRASAALAAGRSG